MKTETKQLLRDLRAAILLGRAEAVNIAMDGMLALPGVSANDRLNENLLDEVISPVGEALSRLPSDLLRPLLKHHLAAGRAIGAVALTTQFVRNINSSEDALLKPANDTRPEVRYALGQTLISLCKDHPERILKIGTSWINNPSPRVRQTALKFLPALADENIDQILSMLDPLISDEDQGIRAGLVDALGDMGGEGNAEYVLELLSQWSTRAELNSWVICRTLSHSWAADYPSEVKSILLEVKSRTNDTKHITHTVKALKRHGIEISV